MAYAAVTVNWSYVPGSTGTLVEYRIQGTSVWTTPTSPADPTTNNSFPLMLLQGAFYDIRLTTIGINCGPRSITFQYTVPLPPPTTTTTSTTSTTTSSSTTTTTTLPGPANLVVIVDAGSVDTVIDVSSGGNPVVYTSGDNFPMIGGQEGNYLATSSSSVNLPVVVDLNNAVIGETVKMTGTDDTIQIVTIVFNGAQNITFSSVQMFPGAFAILEIIPPTTTTTTSSTTTSTTTAAPTTTTTSTTTTSTSSTTTTTTTGTGTTTSTTSTTSTSTSSTSTTSTTSTTTSTTSTTTTTTTTTAPVHLTVLADTGVTDHLYAARSQTVPITYVSGNNLPVTGGQTGAFLGSSNGVSPVTVSVDLSAGVVGEVAKMTDTSGNIQPHTIVSPGAQTVNFTIMRMSPGGFATIELVAPTTTTTSSTTSTTTTRASTTTTTSTTHTTTSSTTTTTTTAISQLSLVGNSPSGACSGTLVTVFYSGTFGVGTILYQDPARTIPLTGEGYIVLATSGGHSGSTPTGNLFTVNSATGQITADTGSTCSSGNVIVTNNRNTAVISNVTGITGFTFGTPLTTGNSQMGSHTGFTGTIVVTLSVGPVANSNLYLSGSYAQTIPISAGATGTFTFSSNAYVNTDQIIITLSA